MAGREPRQTRVVVIKKPSLYTLPGPTSASFARPNVQSSLVSLERFPLGPVGDRAHMQHYVRYAVTDGTRGASYVPSVSVGYTLGSSAATVLPALELQVTVSKHDELPFDNGGLFEIALSSASTAEDRKIPVVLGLTPSDDSPSSPQFDVLPLLEVRPFRKGSGGTRWWKATGHNTLDIPPRGSLTEIGDLFVYRARCTDKVYAWVFYEDGWRLVQTGGPHPTIEDRVLWWRSGDEPSWVTSHTYSTYLGRRRRVGFERQNRARGDTSIREPESRG